MTVRKTQTTKHVFIHFHLPVVLVHGLWFLSVSVVELIELGKGKSSLTTSSSLIIGVKTWKVSNTSNKVLKKEITFSGKVGKSSI